MKFIHLALTLTLTATALGADAPSAPGELRVEPPAATLVHPRRPQSLVVTTTTPDGLLVDLSEKATYASSDAKIATVDAKGWITPVGNGSATITVSAAGKSAAMKIDVKLPQPSAPPLPPAPAPPVPHSFKHDVMPVLSKAGCNMGACHGYSLGKNGFRLSLRGAEPTADYDWLTGEFFERRVNKHNPPASLVLAKPLGEVKHEGGTRFARGSLLHGLLLNWISEGAVSDLSDKVDIESIALYPPRAVVAPGSKQRLQLIAKYSDGSTRDVTRLGIYTANTDSVAGVDDDGLVTAHMLGETAVVARFERIFATSNFIVLQPATGFQPAPVPTGKESAIDAAVIAKLNALRIKPSELADDATFLRRVYVDLIGIQPKPEELQAFVKDTDANKRAKVVDMLLDRPQFVDTWSLKWGDLLQNSRSALSPQAMFAFREWIRSSIAANKPMDQFAREILTGRGGYTESPTSAYFAVSKDADESMQRATQVFAGVRMLCAKCHPHPFENWTQADYYGVLSFFNQTSVKTDPRLPNVPNAKSVMVNLEAGYSTNTRTGRAQPPRYLGGEEAKPVAGAPGAPEAKDLTGMDRRELYATWLTTPANPFFARSMANRVWSYFFHRGVIDPVDDLRTTNPPINPELLEALTKEFVDAKFDVKHLMRRIVLSQTYQRSSVPNATNKHDDANFSRFVPRRMSAEVMLDCLVQATSVPETISGAPGGFNAVQSPDANVRSDFLSLFGKPARAEACECERDGSSNMLQALTFINGKVILGKLGSGSARPAQLIAQKLTNEAIVEQLFLWTLVRQPSEQEKQVCIGFLKASPEAKRADAVQDLMWALLNSRDFWLLQ